MIKSVSGGTLLLLLFSTIFVQAQTPSEGIYVSATNMLPNGLIPLQGAYDWKYLPGRDTTGLAPDTVSGNWIRLRPVDLTLEHANPDGSIEGWFIIRMQIDSTLAKEALSLTFLGSGDAIIYLDNIPLFTFNDMESENVSNQGIRFGPLKYAEPMVFEPNRIYTLAFYYTDHHSAYYGRFTQRELNSGVAILLATMDAYGEQISSMNEYRYFSGIWLTGITLLAFMFLLFFYQNVKQRNLLFIALATLALSISAWIEQLTGGLDSPLAELFYYELLALFVGFLPIIISQIVSGSVPRFLFRILAAVLFLYPVLWFFGGSAEADTLQMYITVSVLLGIFGYSFFILFRHRADLGVAEKTVGIGLILTVFWMFFHTAGMQLELFSNYYRLMAVAMIYLTLPLSFLGYVSIRFNENLVAIRKNLQEIKTLNEEKLLAQREKQKLIESQNIRLEKEVEDRTRELQVRNKELSEAKDDIQKQHEEVSRARDHLQTALKDLKETQEQLVQQEKLASLGQLTAGIAHEIKNPLNFVNNFSDVSIELVEEAREEVLGQKAKVKSEKSDVKRDTEDRGPLTEESPRLPHRDTDGKRESDGVAGARGVSDDAESGPHMDLILEILDDIEANLRKIYEHGSRADSIVKSMLEHSRGGSGDQEPTNLNALVKDFVNLSFHGMRASANPINLNLKFELDESVGDVPLRPEDFSRVIVNLCNNAFDAMREKEKLSEAGQGDDTESDYKPIITIRTKKSDKNITVEIEDNGTGIPADIKNKILQPFFTTKKGTEGTGLGLSISYDLIKAHGGELDISSTPGEGSVFSIKLRSS